MAGHARNPIPANRAEPDDARGDGGHRDARRPEREQHDRHHLGAAVRRKPLHGRGAHDQRHRRIARRPAANSEPGKSPRKRIPVAALSGGAPANPQKEGCGAEQEARGGQARQGKALAGVGRGGYVGDAPGKRACEQERRIREHERVEKVAGPETARRAADERPERDEQARVIDRDGNPIPHLYSAGEFGAIWPDIYNGGCNLEECVSFGRIAAEQCATAPDDAVLDALCANPVSFPADEAELPELGENECLGVGYGIGGEAVTRFPGMLLEAGGEPIDAINGATVSCRAIANAVMDCMAQAGMDTSTNLLATVMNYKADGGHKGK